MRGQSILEYIMLIGIVTMVLIYMGTDMKRGVQSMVKVVGDQMGNQAEADQDFNSVHPNVLVNSIVNTVTAHQQTTAERLGQTTTTVNDSVQSVTSSTTNSFVANQ